MVSKSALPPPLPLSLLFRVVPVSYAEGNEDGIIDVWPVKSEESHLQFRIDRFNGMMGAQIPREFIVDILGRFGCKVEDGEAENVLEVTAPTFRPDLPREIDLYEEVLRLYGMDRIEPTLPGGRGRFGVRTEAAAYA